MDAKIRDALRYLKTLPPMERLVLIMNDPRDSQENHDMTMALISLSRVGRMDDNERRAYELLRTQPQLESGPGGLIYTVTP